MSVAIDDLEELFKAHRTSLTWKAYRMVSCRETAEDLVSEAYARMMDGICDKSVSNAPGLLHQIVHNLAIDHLRKEQTRRRFVGDSQTEMQYMEVASPKASPEQIAGDRQRLGQLKSALSEVPERARIALMLNRVEGLSYPQIARRLGVSESTIYKDVRLALAQCLDAVEDD